MELTTVTTAPKRNDGVSTTDSPEHTGAFEPELMTVLQPASMTPEPTKSLAAELGIAHEPTLEKTAGDAEKTAFGRL